MDRLSLLIGIVASIILAACAGVQRVQYSPLVSLSRPARPPEQVKAFLVQQPARPYEEVGILTYRAGAAENYGDVVQYMREKAAQLGADGIIMIGSGAGPSVLVGQVMATMTDYRATVIVYKD